MSEIPTEISKLVYPYIKRANELDAYQPVVSYYCKMYAAQLVLESQLHLENTDVAQYIETLLNDIEVTKNSIEQSSDKISEILNDREKSFKLVLGFASAIFSKGFNEIKNHNSSKTTVQDFMASLNFFQVLHLWSDYYTTKEDEIEKQIKYAKYHSNRILKSIKENQDPNDYISPEEESELENLESKTGSDLELPNPPKIPTEAIISDSFEPSDIGDFLPEAPSEISIENLPLSHNETLDYNDKISLPTAPEAINGELNMPKTPVLIKGKKNILGLPNAPEFEVEIEDKHAKVSKTVAPSLPKKPIGSGHKEPTKHVSKKEVEEIWKNDDIISKAQKKAKFAISALNYEDIETAIKELQDALKLLKGE